LSRSATAAIDRRNTAAASLTVAAAHPTVGDDTVGFAAARRLQQEPAASSASDEDGNTQHFTARPGVAFQGSTSSVVTNKKRKNSSPYWYKGAPVFELEGYTDGTPLRPGHVWVEYDSGTVVQVKDAELVKKLPPARNSRRRLSHNLFAIRSTTSREANTQEERNSSEALPPSNVPAATSPPESIIVNHRRNQAAFGEPPGHDCRQRSNESPVPFPVGYRFYHTVSKGKHHGGYMCLAEVKAVIGNSEFDSFLLFVVFTLRLHKSNFFGNLIEDGDFKSPNSTRLCHYYDLNDGSKTGQGSPWVKTIGKSKMYVQTDATIMGKDVGICLGKGYDSDDESL